MNTMTERKLEYDQMKQRVVDCTMSYLGRQLAEAMQPLTDVKQIERLLREADEARRVIEHGASAPIPTLEGMDKIIALLGKGYLLDGQELMVILEFLDCTVQMKRFMAKKVESAPTIAAYVESFTLLEDLRSELTRCLSYGQVVDHATGELAKIRKKIVVLQERMKKRIDAALQKYKNYLQDSIVSTRGDRYALSVKRAHKKMVSGTVLDESSSGQTVFIEPADIHGLQTELGELRVDEEREVMKVLGMLTGLVEQHALELAQNLQLMGNLDFLFAKAKYALQVDGRRVPVSTTGEVIIQGGRHPLLGNDAVPLDFRIGRGYQGLLITGPNTGGKTVTLKTVGLLTMMVQSGLLAPVQEGSTFRVYNHVLVDIGDGQSIEASLSTFSAHIRNLIGILEVADATTLVLLDELASGTDPGEGIGLSIAVLEELHRRGCTIVATTHFNEIKRFAARTQGFMNARMAFDVESLKPLHRLVIGEAGQSYAFAIAQRLGMPASLIARSRELAVGQNVNMDDIADIKPVPEGAEVGASFPRQVRDLDSETSRSSADEKPVLQVGDRVWIHPLKRTGILYKLPDDRGNVWVIVQKQKLRFSVKRISPYLSKDQLYPDDYDLEIVLESKDVRKKHKQMNKRHVPGLVIDHDPDSPKA